MGRRVNALVDTNVLVDYLQGRPEAAAELDRYHEVLVSAISVVELVVGAGSPSRITAVDALLRSCRVITVDEAIARDAGQLRRETRLRLPDALVWACARAHGALLVTRDDGFPEGAPDVRMPYRLVP